MSVLAETLISKSRPKARRKRNMIVLGSVLSILGAVVVVVQQGKDSYELWAVSTGGEGYCHLQYLLNTSVVMKFAAVNEGEIPLYDVSMEITDLTHWHEIQAQEPNASQNFVNFDNIFKWDKETKVNLPLGNFRPREVRWVWDAPFPKSELQAYYVSILARNGLAEEEILLHRDEKGNFVAASRVWRKLFRPKGGKATTEILNESVPEEFRKFYPNSIPWTPNLGQ